MLCAYLTCWAKPPSTLRSNRLASCPQMRQYLRVSSSMDCFWSRSCAKVSMMIPNTMLRMITTMTRKKAKSNCGERRSRPVRGRHQGARHGA